MRRRDREGCGFGSSRSSSRFLVHRSVARSCDGHVVVYVPPGFIAVELLADLASCLPFGSSRMQGVPWISYWAPLLVLSWRLMDSQSHRLRFHFDRWTPPDNHELKESPRSLDLTQSPAFWSFGYRLWPFLEESKYPICLSSVSFRLGVL